MRDGIVTRTPADADGFEQALSDAVAWQVRMESAPLKDAELQAFAIWRNAHPDHQRAWLRIESMLNDAVAVVRRLDGRAPGHTRAVHRALLAPPRRKLLRGALAVGGIGAGTALLAHRSVPLDAWTADLHTSTGERRQVALDDGSQLILNARTAVDVDIGATHRRVHLRRGDLVVTASRDRSRPFQVDTQQGVAEASAGRFLVAAGDGASDVTAIDTDVALRLHTGLGHTLRIGESARLNATQLQPLPGDALARAAWVDGRIAVENASLVEVVAALRPYYAGVIQTTRAADAVRVFGVFGLDRPAEVLQTLAHSLPLSVRHYGNWLLRVDVRQGSMATA